MRGMKKGRGFVLVSGGLDSQLAVCVLREQGAHVEAVTFSSPFFGPDAGRRAAGQLGIPIRVVDFTKDIIELLNDPPHGFGSRMNPCIDCHARMLRRAGALMDEQGYDFIATGEVLDQRPMSQNRASLEIVSKACGYPDRVVRPLSARLLPETLPEREGLLDRAGLLALQGRGRKPQMELAERYGLADYPSPAGGCRLTEPNFAERLADLQRYEGLAAERVHAIELLRYGRHFRSPQKHKIVVGRNQAENESLRALARDTDMLLAPTDVPGPTALVPGGCGSEDRLLAAGMVARYSDAPLRERVVVEVTFEGATERLDVMPASPDYVESLRI